MQHIPDGFKLVPLWAIEMVSFEGFKRRWFYHYSTELTQLEPTTKRRTNSRNFLNVISIKILNLFGSLCTTIDIRKTS